LVKTVVSGARAATVAPVEQYPSIAGFGASEWFGHARALVNAEVR